MMMMIMAIINNNGDCKFPGKTPLWIFTSVKIYSPAANFTCHGFREEFYDFIGYFKHFQTSLLFHFLQVFLTSVIWGAFHWSLRDSKSSQVSRNLADLNNALVWMVSILPLISSSSSLFLPSLCRLFQVHLVQLVLPSPSCFTVFFSKFSAKTQIFLYIFFFF